MTISKTDIVKNGIWLTLPPLLFSLSLMTLLPNALTPAQFNEGIPDVLVSIESVGRMMVFAMPAFFSVGLSTPTQKQGLIFVLGWSNTLLPVLRHSEFFPQQCLE
jgi:hypothetical protein